MRAVNLLPRDVAKTKTRQVNVPLLVNVPSGSGAPKASCSPAAGVKLSSRLCTMVASVRFGALRTTVIALLSAAPSALPVSVRVPFRSAA